MHWTKTLEFAIIISLVPNGCLISNLQNQPNKQTPICGLHFDYYRIFLT